MVGGPASGRSAGRGRVPRAVNRPARTWEFCLAAFPNRAQSHVADFCRRITVADHSLNDSSRGGPQPVALMRRPASD